MSPAWSHRDKFRASIWLCRKWESQRRLRPRNRRRAHSMGGTPLAVGVRCDWDRFTQGRRSLFAPTLGSVSERRWRSVRVERSAKRLQGNAGQAFWRDSTPLTRRA